MGLQSKQEQLKMLFKRTDLFKIVSIVYSVTKSDSWQKRYINDKINKDKIKESWNIFQHKVSDFNIQQFLVFT